MHVINLVTYILSFSKLFFKGTTKWFTRRVFEEHRRVKSISMACPQIPSNPE
jgi:hypothetical protein